MNVPGEKEYRNEGVVTARIVMAPYLKANVLP